MNPNYFTSALQRLRTNARDELTHLLLKILTAGAVFAVALGLIAGTGSQAEALSLALASENGTTPRYNSQNVPALRPAFNIDPSAARGGGDIAVVGGSALLAQAGPSGTIADIESYPSSSQISVYTVHEGDTLGGIAKMFGVSVNTIVWANDIKGGGVSPGQQLIILPITGIKHTITKGETLTSLAKAYKSDAGDIAQYNGLPDDGALAVGDTVIIPNGEIPAASAPRAQNSHARTIRSIASGKTTEPYLGGGGPALAGYFSWPLAGGVVTQGLHGWNAVDIGAPRGTSIYAAAAGTVIAAKQNGGWNGGYGNYVVVAHDNGTQTLYAHMSRVLVSAGASVDQGDTIGKVGSTGESTGSHLHFEVRGAANPFAD